MIKFIQFERVTRQGRSRDLGVLAAGVNLLWSGGVEIVSRVEEREGLYEIETIMPEGTATEYCATRTMLNYGHLKYIKQKPIPPQQVAEFYKQHSIQQQIAEATG
jgi:hypothetical protein